MNEEEITVIEYGQKRCTVCGILKPLSDFYSQEGYKFGVSSKCKDCKAKYDHQYHKKNREKILDRGRQRQKKNRKKVLDMLDGPKCVYCGCAVYEALQINHKNGGGRQDPFTKRETLVNAIISGRRTTDDLEVTCYVCNAWHKLVELDGIPDGWTITWKDPQ